MKTLDFTDNEIIKLKQLVCDHELADDKKYNHHGCSCCGSFDQICRICDLEIEHECNDHDTDDGYCNSCR